MRKRQRCSICSSEALRASVDGALLRGCALREIARMTGAGINIVFRHRRDCVDPKALELAKADANLERSALMRLEIITLAHEAERLKKLAETAGDIRTALQGIREISRLLELRARLFDLPPAPKAARISYAVTFVNGRPQTTAASQIEEQPAIEIGARPQ